MDISYPMVGICGLSCRLCPRYHTEAESRCPGCKSQQRMAVGCPFITCAVKGRGIEFCGECDQQVTCERWRQHREFGQQHDTFICYQKLEDNIRFIQQNGMPQFEIRQQIREGLLTEMLQQFNEGRSKSYSCIAATVLDIEELRTALTTAQERANGLDIRDRAKVMHAVLDIIAAEKGYCLRLRK